MSWAVYPQKVGWIDTKETVLHSVKFYPTQTSSWLGIYTFFFKKTSVDHEILGLMFFFKFSEYINRCLHYDTLDGFGYSGVERRCGKIPNMSCMSHVSMGIWIDIRVRLR